MGSFVGAGHSEQYCNGSTDHEAHITNNRAKGFLVAAQLFPIGVTIATVQNPTLRVVAWCP